MVSKVEPRFSGPSAGSLVQRCDFGLGGSPLSGSRRASASRLGHFIRHANLIRTPSIGRLPFFGVSPLRPKPGGEAGERDVRPRTSNVQLQIFTGLLPAAGGSLPEESRAGFEGLLWESRGAKQVADALGNRDGKCAKFISPIRTRSRRHFAPHFLTGDASH